MDVRRDRAPRDLAVVEPGRQPHQGIHPAVGDLRLQQSGARLLRCREEAAQLHRLEAEAAAINEAIRAINDAAQAATREALAWVRTVKLDLARRNVHPATWHAAIALADVAAADYWRRQMTARGHGCVHGPGPLQ